MIAADLSYLDRVVLRIVSDVYQRTRQPVRTTAVESRLGKCDRFCRRYLAGMELKGLVLRVGQRGGWLPVELIEPRRVAEEYVRMRQYAAMLESQLDQMRCSARPMKAAEPRRRRKRAEPEPAVMWEQPPLPGFSALVPVTFLN